jgi:hypothetical protein
MAAVAANDSGIHRQVSRVELGQQPVPRLPRGRHRRPLACAGRSYRAVRRRRTNAVTVRTTRSAAPIGVRRVADCLMANHSQPRERDVGHGEEEDDLQSPISSAARSAATVAAPAASTPAASVSAMSAVSASTTAPAAAVHHDEIARLPGRRRAGATYEFPEDGHGRMQTAGAPALWAPWFKSRHPPNRPCWHLSPRRRPTAEEPLPSAFAAATPSLARTRSSRFNTSTARQPSLALVGARQGSRDWRQRTLGIAWKPAIGWRSLWWFGPPPSARPPRRRPVHACESPIWEGGE